MAAMQAPSSATLYFISTPGPQEVDQAADRADCPRGLGGVI